MDAGWVSWPPDYEENDEDISESQVKVISLPEDNNEIVVVSNGNADDDNSASD